MSLIPEATAYSFKRGDHGTGVWAIQRALNESDFDLDEDGNFGKSTKAAVTEFQLDHDLTGDGVFGPKSSAAMADDLGDGFDAVADGLLRGIVEGESGNLIAAVSHTAPGGVDCGYVQRRVYENDYEDVKVVHEAFDSQFQISHLAETLVWTHDNFLGEPGAPDDETAWRLAALAHNYPSGAQTIASQGIDNLSDYWTTAQDWVLGIGAKFPDGIDVRTPLQWARFYALGAPRHDWPGLVTKYL